MDLNDLENNIGKLWFKCVDHSQLRWLGPEKGVVHMAVSAIFNCLWDLIAKKHKKPLWQFVVESEPEKIVSWLTFKYIEEDGVIGSTNILENVTTFNFDEQNFVTFRTRQNREIDLTEYYDLIYEYKNDCLVAGIKYNKTYYKDRDLQPTEDFMFSIKLIPLTAFEQKFAN